MEQVAKNKLIEGGRFWWVNAAWRLVYGRDIRDNIGQAHAESVVWRKFETKKDKFKIKKSWWGGIWTKAKKYKPKDKIPLSLSQSKVVSKLASSAAERIQIGGEKSRSDSRSG